MAAHSEKVIYHGGGSDSVYGLGMIGAWIFYIGRATTPRERALGFLKGLVWPALLVHEVLKFFSEDLPAPRRLAPARSVSTPQPVQAQASKPSVAPKARSTRKSAQGSKSRTKKPARK